jgi:hypothetical protein
MPLHLTRHPAQYPFTPHPPHPLTPAPLTPPCHPATLPHPAPCTPHTLTPHPAPHTSHPAPPSPSLTPAPCTLHPLQHPTLSTSQMLRSCAERDEFFYVFKDEEDGKQLLVTDKWFAPTKACPNAMQAVRYPFPCAPSAGPRTHICVPVHP